MSFFFRRYWILSQSMRSERLRNRSGVRIKRDRVQERLQLRESQMS